MGMAAFDFNQCRCSNIHSQAHRNNPAAGFLTNSKNNQCTTYWLAQKGSYGGGQAGGVTDF